MNLPGRFVIDTVGATAPEFVSAALSRHPHVTVLPGLAFVRDDLRLYRRHRLAGRTAHEVFDALWLPSFEPTGRMWAGIPRRFSPQQRKALDIGPARRSFAADWSAGFSYAETLFLFASHVAPAVGAARATTAWIGFAGAPFLRTIDWGDLMAHDIEVLSAGTSLPHWLALVSHRSVVNCIDALHTWIIHAVLIEVARLHGVSIHPVNSVEIAQGDIGQAFSALRLEASAGLLSEPGPGHARFDSREFEYVESLARALESMLAGDPTYESALTAAQWAPRVAKAPRIQHLIRLYLQYWEGSAHIHFDTLGPLEAEIVATALSLSGLTSHTDPRDFERRFPQAFFHELVRFRSFSFESPQVSLDCYLGELEQRLPLPQAPYFAFAAVAYLERALGSQKKWSDSYLPLASSALYQALRSQPFQRIVETQGLEARLQALEGADREIAGRAAARLQAGSTMPD